MYSSFHHLIVRSAPFDCFVAISYMTCHSPSVTCSYILLPVSCEAGASQQTVARMGWHLTKMSACSSWYTLPPSNLHPAKYKALKNLKEEVIVIAPADKAIQCQSGDEHIWLWQDDQRSTCRLLYLWNCPRITRQPRRGRRTSFF